DPSANPYLATAAVLKAGLDGIRQELDLDTPVNQNISKMSKKEREIENVEDLPTTLYTAPKAQKEDEAIQEALGDHIYKQFHANKLVEWTAYRSQSSQWKIDEYLKTY